MANSLVIGSNSFVGSILINCLKKTGNVVGIYHRQTDRLQDDVTNLPLSELANLHTDFDHIYIISAYIPEKQLTSITRQNMYDANIALVNRICEKFSSGKIIYCSSVSVYDVKNEPITETDSVGGLNEYGVSKLWGEHIVKRANNYAIVRCSSIFGPGMNTQTIMPMYIRQGLQGQITVWGNGERLQNYIHVLDVANFLTTAANYDKNGTFLAVAENSLSNLDLANIIKSELNCQIVFANTDNSASFYYNNEYTKRTLNYTPQFSIRQGIKETIQWIKKMS
jgi:UDP-glucose 4-epimerase